MSYALCNDRRTLLWFANQRAVEYHPTLVRADRLDHVTHLVLDLDPPEGATSRAVVAAAHLVRQALADAGLAGAVKTSGAKGVHIFVPVDDGAPMEDAAAATRAIAGARRGARPGDRHHRLHEGGPRRQGVRRLHPRRRATVVAAYSPRVRPGVPVSFPVAWDDLDAVTPPTSPSTPRRASSATRDPWAEQMPEPQHLSDELIDEGHAIPVARVQAMHEGKRRARARKSE